MLPSLVTQSTELIQLQLRIYEIPENFYYKEAGKRQAALQEQIQDGTDRG